MSDSREASAWSTYWSQHGVGFCLPAAPPVVTRALQQNWKIVADSFAPGSRLIDLGCGAGALAHLLVQLNPGVEVAGVDFSQIPTSRSGRVVLHPGVRMESLPFADDSFDGAVSQFGIEYAEVAGAASELARVLKPGAAVAFVVHHADSPITAHNRRRRSALESVIGADVGSAFISGDQAGLAQVLDRLRNSYRDQDVIAEFSTGLNQAITQGPRERNELWTDLSAKVADERAILGALEGAAVTDMGTWLTAFDPWFGFEPARVLADDRGVPFAWAVRGTRL